MLNAKWLDCVDIMCFIGEFRFSMLALVSQTKMKDSPSQGLDKLTVMSISESPVHQCCERKAEHTEGNHANTNRICKLHTDNTGT